MSDHYYSKKPQTASKPMLWSFTLRGHMFKFVTDTGCF